MSDETEDSSRNKQLNDTEATSVLSVGHFASRFRLFESLKSSKNLIFVSLFVFLTLWFVIGTLWFPFWWYGAVFTGHSSVWESVTEGFSLLWENFRFQLIVIILMVVLGFAAIVKFRSYLTSFTKRYLWPIIACCMFAILVDVLALNATQRPYLMDNDKIQTMLAQSQALLSLVVDRVGNGQAPLQIAKPVDFMYFDSKKIRDLYAQIQPSLVEKTRKVSSTAKGHAGVEAKIGKDGVGSLGADASHDDEREQTSELEKSEANAASEALDVINYCLENHRVSFYSTEESWRVAYTLRANALKRASQIYAGSGNLPGGPKIDEVIDQGDAQKQIIEDSNKELKDELTKLADLILIDGIFEEQQVGNSTRLVQHFSKGLHKVDFIAEMPHDSSFKKLGSGGRLRVFGRINHPLDAQSVISIQPIAIF
jgi:hypothetical protein